MNRNGFVPILIILAVVLVGLVGSVSYVTIKNPDLINSTIQNLTPKGTQEKEATRTISPTSVSNQISKSTPTSTPLAGNKTSVPTKKPTVTAKPSSVTPTPTSTSQSGGNTSSCSYNLNVASGGVEVTLQSQSGYFKSTPTIQIKALNGCKVLGGGATDLLGMTGFNSGSTVGGSFGGVPPGEYDVRAQYSGSWTDYKRITVSSAQLTKTSFTVAGDASPTPAFTPKCYGISTYPSNQGAAPFNVIFSGQGTYNLDYSPSGYIWDFTGDGSWDTSASGNGVTYTYSTAGTYTVKMKTVTGTWESSICQTTIIVN